MLAPPRDTLDLRELSGPPLDSPQERLIPNAPADTPTTGRNGHHPVTHDLAIEAVQLERSFGSFVAVDKIDLAVRKSEIYGFLGPNGAGKSTTSRLLCTLTAPTGGRAQVAGYDVVRDPEAVRLRIGVALQATAVDLQQTGSELLRQQGRYYGLNNREIDQRLEDLKGLVDLGDALNQRIKSYSGGMKRRIDLAAALIHNPEVLFLDEPTTGLDPVSRAKVWEEVRRLNADLGMTIFLTTQYLEEADELADRVGIIDRGRIVAEGTPDDLKRSLGADLVHVQVDDADAARRAIANLPGVAKIDSDGDRLTVSVSDGPSAVAPIAVALSNADVRVRSLTLREPSLDDVFLTMTGHHLREDEA